MVIASLISLHDRALRRRQDLSDTCCDAWGVSDPPGRGCDRRPELGGGSLTPLLPLFSLSAARATRGAAKTAAPIDARANPVAPTLTEKRIAAALRGALGGRQDCSLCAE